jgi:hypothetical protein
MGNKINGIKRNPEVSKSNRGYLINKSKNQGILSITNPITIHRIIFKRELMEG